MYLYDEIQQYLQQFQKKTTIQRMSQSINRKKSPIYAQEDRENKFRRQKSQDKIQKSQKQNSEKQMKSKCFNCQNLMKKLILIQEGVRKMKHENQLMADETQILFANFSYILILVADNLQAKFEKVLATLIKQQQQILKQAQYDSKLAIRTLAEQHHMQDELLKAKIHKLEAQIIINSSKLILKTQQDSKSIGSSIQSDDRETQNLKQLMISTRSEGKILIPQFQSYNLKNCRKSSKKLDMESIDKLKQRIRNIKSKLER